MRLPDIIHERDVFGRPTEYVSGVWVIAGMLIGAFIICAVVVGVVIAGDRHSCYATGNAMHRETEYPSAFTGCLIHTSGGWIPLDKWRAVKVTR